MHRGVQAVNRWLLRTSPDIVTKLEDIGEQERMQVLKVDRKNPLYLDSMFIIVPRGIEVYDVNYNSHANEKRNLFFTARVDDKSSAYLSYILTQVGRVLNPLKNPAGNTFVLFDFPWLDVNKTSAIYMALFEKRYHNLLSTRFTAKYANCPPNTSHPLSE